MDLDSLLRKCSKKFSHELQRVKLSSESIAALDIALRQFHESLRPNATEYEMRRRLPILFGETVKGIFGNVGGYPVVEAFGSFVMGLDTAKSDLDLSVNFNGDRTSSLTRDQKISILKELNKVLYRYQREGRVCDVQPILGARVPIVKFIDRVTGVECDVSVENKDGVVKSIIIHLISSIDERFQVLSFLMKVWAKVHGINSSKDHTLNSLSIILLVAFHLQTRNPPILPPFSAILKDGTDLAKIQKYIQQFRHFGGQNKETIAELFVALLCQLLSVRDMWKQGLCVSTYEGSWIIKEWDTGPGIISVEDFTDQSQNCARAVERKQFHKIYQCIWSTVQELVTFRKGKTKAPTLKKLFGLPTQILEEPGTMEMVTSCKTTVQVTEEINNGEENNQVNRDSSNKEIKPVPDVRGRKRKRLLKDKKVTKDEYGEKKELVLEASRHTNKNKKVKKGDITEKMEPVSEAPMDKRKYPFSTQNIVKAVPGCGRGFSPMDRSTNQPNTVIPKKQFKHLERRLDEHHGNILRIPNNLSLTPSTGVHGLQRPSWSAYRMPITSPSTSQIYSFPGSSYYPHQPFPQNSPQPQQHPLQLQNDLIQPRYVSLNYNLQGLHCPSGSRLQQGQQVPFTFGQHPLAFHPSSSLQYRQDLASSSSMQHHPRPSHHLPPTRPSQFDYRSYNPYGPHRTHSMW